MIVHLLESTLLLAMAILIAHIPRLAARTRYAIVFAALVKFAVPSAIVPRILAIFGIDLTRMAKGTIIISALGPLTDAHLANSSAPIWPVMATALWAAIAAALAIRAFVRGRAGARLALAGAHEADTCELAVLARARTRVKVSRAIRLVVSDSITTPATTGMLRPVIVIPSATPLGDSELETILTHECAHITRHDNLLGIIETILGCALWFHPLVWIARRALDAAREEACDAMVISSGDADVYVSALGKVCVAAVFPRAAGISCIVSNTIHERMEAIMSFGTHRLLPHRAVTAIVVALLAVVTIGSGVARALPAGSDDSAASKYKVEVTATRLDSYFDFLITIRNRADGEILSTARVKSAIEEWGTAESKRIDPAGEHITVVRAKGHADGTASVEVQIDKEAPAVFSIVAKPAHMVKGNSESSENISIDLKDAEIRDVLRTFAQLTKLKFIVDDDVTGNITISVTDTPWTTVLDILLRQNKLRQERTGNTIYIHRQ